MTEAAGGANGRRYSPIPCPRRRDDTLSLLHVETPPAKYLPVKLSYAESAQLTRASRAADESLAQSHEGIRDAAAQVTRAWQRAAAALQRLSGLVAEGLLKMAGEERREALDAHQHEGPEDRRVRPGWQRAPVVWGLILTSALYDTFFFATTFQDALDLDEDVSLGEKAIACIPGAGIAIALIVAGSLLGDAYFRHRSRVERRAERGPLNWRIVLNRTFREWRPGTDRRETDGLPWPSWPLAIGFALLVLGVLGVWAWLRGQGMTDSSLQWPLVVLLLLLTISAVLLKAIAKNSYAERDQRTRKGLAAAQARAVKLETEARGRISDLTAEWHRLDAVIEEAAAAARRHLIDAWTELAESREQHQRTGPIAPAFAEPSPDDPAGRSFFEGLRAPPIRTYVLQHGWETLYDCWPKPLNGRLDLLLEQLDKQVAGAMGTKTAQPSEADGKATTDTDGETGADTSD